MDFQEMFASYYESLGRLTTDEYVTMAVSHSMDLLLWKDGILLANGVGERCILPQTGRTSYRLLPRLHG